MNGKPLCQKQKMTREGSLKREQSERMPTDSNT